MGLPIRNLITSGLDLAFSLTPDVQKTGTHRGITGSAYNPATGGMTPVQEDREVTFILAAYSEREIDGEKIQAGDEKAVMRIVAGQEITIHDQLIDEDGVIRQVVNFRKDPTEQVVICQTRKLQNHVESVS